MRNIINLVLRIPLYQSFRVFNYPKILPVNYTLLISTRCNSRCLTCNIWKQKHEELTLKEWEKVFKSLGTSLFWVTISGGEPFLQKNLAEMVVLLDEICQPAIINIPTNSLLPETIKQQTLEMLRKIKKAKLIINLSLDGVGEEHDKIRGIKGNFRKVMENYQNLKEIQKQYPNLVIGFMTVISNFNIDKVKEVFDLVFELEPDQYVTEIAEERVELGTVGMPITPNFKQYSGVIDYLIEKMKKHHFSGIGRISRAFRLEYYQFVKDWLLGKKLLPDFAGFASCEITSWGEIWPSCIKGENIGNIREVNYDFKKIWFSKKADKIRKKIKKEGTSYPLANAFYTNVLFHLPMLIRVFKEIVLG